MRYKLVVAQVINDIETEKRKPGSPMPSIRKMAKLCGVSITTINNAYHALEDTGYLISKPKTGFYVALPPVHLSEPVLPQFKSVERDFSLKNNVNTSQELHLRSPLGLSQLSPTYVPYKAFKRSVKRAIRRLDDAVLHFYPEASGESCLKEALSHHFLKYGFPFKPDELTITNGCINGIRHAIETVTKEGDTIAINSPCFNGLLELLAKTKRKVIEIPSVQDGIDLAQFELLAKEKHIQAGLFSCTHMNPQGTSLSSQQKQRLAQLANLYEIPVIEDDVYLELSHTKLTPLPSKYWDNDGYILWCGSVSKTLSAGLRLGWCLAGRYQKDYVSNMETSQLGISSPLQHGLADFISNGHYAKHVQEVRTVLKAQILEYRRFIAAYFPSTVAVSSPAGGLVLWIQCQNLNTDMFKVKLRKSTIDVRLGELFSTLPHYDNCLRINCGNPLTEELSAQLKMLAEIINVCTQ